MTMISSPQEIEQTAVNIANWINYNNRPFVLAQENGNTMFLVVLTEEQMMMLQKMMSPPVEQVDSDKKPKK